MFVIYAFCCLEFRAAPKLLMGFHRAGGAGIVLGLALYSSNISRTLGVRVAKITYARGFSAELGTAITVAIASRYGEMLITVASHWDICCAFRQACTGICQQSPDASTPSKARIPLTPSEGSHCRPPGVHHASHHRRAHCCGPHGRHQGRQLEGVLQGGCTDVLLTACPDCMLLPAQI